MLFKNKYRAETARLRDWDYSFASWYYVTINSKNHKKWFGEVVDDEVRLNNLGKVVNEYWSNIPGHFKNVELDEYVVMPNHMHGIIIINDMVTVETPDRASLHLATLGEIINQFKGSVKRWANKNNLADFMWQERFYDHIIRNDKSLFAIRKYIRHNPLKWTIDKYYCK